MANRKGDKQGSFNSYPQFDCFLWAKTAQRSCKCYTQTMSFDALAWASKCRVGSAGRKLVLLALADRHNSEEGVARPSIAWIAEWADLNRKTVINALQELERMGLIADSGIRAGHTLQIKAYRLNIETVPKVEQSPKRNGSTFSRKQSQKRDTEPVLEPVKGESETREATIRALPQWRAFKAMRTQIKKPVNPTSERRLLSKLLSLEDDGYPPGDVLDQSTEHCWQGVFKIEEREDGRAINRPNIRGVGGPRPDPTLAIVRAAIEAQRQGGGDYR